MLLRALQILAKVVLLLSWGALARVGAVIGWLAGSLFRIRRGAVEAAMVRAGISDPAREAHAMYRGLGAGSSSTVVFWPAGLR